MVEIQPQNHAVALATLAVNTALQIGQRTLTQSFLAKHLRATYVLRDADAGDTIVFGMARGDQSVTNIKTALELAQLERDQVNQAQARQVLFETVRTITISTVAPGAEHFIDIPLGGGKGIPFEDGDGYQFFAFNVGADAQVAGATALVFGDITGVWL